MFIKACDICQRIKIKSLQKQTLPAQNTGCLLTNVKFVRNEINVKQF